MQEHSTNHFQNEEISLGDILSKILEFWKEWKKQSVLIGTFIVLGLCFNGISAFLTPVFYEAHLTFMLNDDGETGGRQSGLISQILGGGNAAGYNLDKLLQLSQSRRIVNGIILDKDTIGGQGDYIGNHIIKIYNLHDDWKKEGREDISEFLFQRDTVSPYDVKNNKVLKILFGKLVSTLDDELFFKIEANKNTGIITLTVNTLNEELSYELANTAFQRISNYYTSKSIERQSKNYRIIKARADSLESVLNKAEYSLASFDDSNRNLLLNQYRVKKQKLQREAAKLASAYTEAYKNLEITKFALENETPFIQVIDAPFFPLKKIKISILKSIIFGAVIGLLISLTIISLQKTFKDSLQQAA